MTFMLPAKFTEIADRKLLEIIVSNWDDIPISEKSREPWEINGKQMVPVEVVRKLLNAMNENGEMTVTYHYSALRQKVGGTGRRYATNAISLQGIARSIRHTISHAYYRDIDIKNCHPCILFQMCKKMNYPCGALGRYIEQRDELIAASGLDKDLVKEQVIKIIYGGSLDNHILEVCPWMGPLLTEVTMFQTEMMRKLENKKLIKAIEKQKGATHYNIPGSLLSHILQEEEDKVLMTCLEYLKDVHKVDITKCCLMFDGFQLPKTYEVTTEMLGGLQKIVLERTGWDLVFLEKPMDEIIDLTGFSKKFVYGQVAEHDNGAAKILIEYIGPNIHKCNNLIYIRNKKGVWVYDKTSVDQELYRYCAEAEIYKYNDKMDKLIPYSQNTTSARNIFEQLRAELPIENSFVDNVLWKGSYGKLFFEDGVYNFLLGKFIPLDEEDPTQDLTTIRISRKFPKKEEEKMKAVYEVLLSIFGSDALVNNYLEHMARGVAGHIEDKSWVMLQGERNCGKGVLTTLMANTLRDYVVQITADNFLMERNRSGGDEAKKFSWLLDCWWKRIMITNEVSVDASNPNFKINGNLIKGKIASGGDVVEARKNYMNEVRFVIQSKLFMFNNDMPQISPPDAVQTLSQFQFPFVFKNPEDMIDSPPSSWRVKNDEVKAMCNSEAFAEGFTWLIIDAYKRHRVVDTMEVKTNSKEFAGDQGDDDTLLAEIFQVTGNERDQISSDQIKFIIQQKKLNMSLNKIKRKLIGLGAVASDYCVINGKRTRGLRGVCEISNIVNDSDMDD